jgi:SWI/SNF-related matrix-associated actin-dependent regulator 1 of chromatin subfamily A
MAVRLTYRDGKYLALTDSWRDKEGPKQAGFHWDRAASCWWTAADDVALKLRSVADEETRARLDAIAAHREESLTMSRQAATDVALPVPSGLEYLPYQRAGIAYALSRPATLFGDEMGLGKTIQAIGVANATPDLKSALVICPASLKINWLREWSKWTTHPSLTVGIASGDAWPSTDVVIVNYDILGRHEGVLRGREWDLLVIDEAHYLKNPSTIRGRQVFGGRWMEVEEQPGGAKLRVTRTLEPIAAKRRLALTGTPIPNRPREAQPILGWLAPETFGHFFGFAMRYCAAHQKPAGRSRLVWDFNGASRLDELQDRMRSTVMVRRLKVDVLTELPRKRRQVIELPANGARSVIEAELEAEARHEETLEGLRAAVEVAALSEDIEGYEAAVARLRAAERVAFTEMAKRRHDTAVAKTPYVVDHVKAALDDGLAKVIVFAWHRDVIDTLREGLAPYGVVKVTGDDSSTARQAAVDVFQADPSVRVFLGNIRAAGVGLTLTAADTVIFAELDWVPGNVTQAEDRAHRIGQRNAVLVQHLVLEGSLDARMANTIVSKQRVADAALDNETDGSHALPVEVDEALLNAPSPDPAEAERQAAMRSRREALAAAEAEARALPRSQSRHDARAVLAREAEGLTAERVAAIHAGLRTLSAYCDGAINRDDMGFNKADSYSGKRLAALAALTPLQAAYGARLVRKYGRQLDPALVAIATGREA